jgi:hypothetical protein
MDDPSVNSESDDAPSVLVRNDQYPVRPQSHRLTSEQINAMKTIFRVTDEGGPGRSAGIYKRMVVEARIRRTTSLFIDIPIGFDP